jgi:G3E family GTPase
MSQIPVTVVTGFLGAGKTTLLDRWLRDFRPGEVAVIVNEVAAIGVDAELLAERARRVVEIAGGCICCTTFHELVGALRELASSQPAPRRILIETSGAASPAGVLRAVTRQPDLALDGVVTVVDGTRVAVLERSDLAMEQVGYADVIVLSHADLADDATLSDATLRVTAHSAATTIAPAARGVLHDARLTTLDALLAARTDVPHPREHRSVHDHGGSTAIESLALTYEGALDEDAFGDWMESELATFEGRLLRVKGVLAIDGLDERVIVQGVADRVEVTVGALWECDAPRASRLVIVGFGLERERLEQGFARCAAATTSP